MKRLAVWAAWLVAALVVAGAELVETCAAVDRRLLALAGVGVPASGEPRNHDRQGNGQNEGQESPEDEARGSRADEYSNSRADASRRGHPFQAYPPGD